MKRLRRIFLGHHHSEESCSVRFRIISYGLIHLSYQHSAGQVLRFKIQKDCIHQEVLQRCTADNCLKLFSLYLLSSDALSGFCTRNEIIVLPHIFHFDSLRFSVCTAKLQALIGNVFSWFRHIEYYVLSSGDKCKTAYKPVAVSILVH